MQVHVAVVALFKLGRIDEARAAFERRNTIMNDAEEGRTYDEEASALYEEAKHLLEGSDAQPRAPENLEEGEK